MNTPIKFPTAKLLKEKGFRETCDYKYHISNTKGLAYHRFSESSKYYITAPTIAEVVMWLYEKYGIWITAVPQGLLTTWTFILFNANPEKGRIVFNSPSFDSPIAAYEAAIDYTLNNLI